MKYTIAVLYCLLTFGRDGFAALMSEAVNQHSHIEQTYPWDWISNTALLLGLYHFTKRSSYPYKIKQNFFFNFHFLPKITNR